MAREASEVFVRNAMERISKAPLVLGRAFDLVFRTKRRTTTSGFYVYAV